LSEILRNYNFALKNGCVKMVNVSSELVDRTCYCNLKAHVCLHRINTDVAGTHESTEGWVWGEGGCLVWETGIGRRLYLIKEDTGSSAGEEVRWNR